jgi:phosphoadenosine phosphosulfate reductase
MAKLTQHDLIDLNKTFEERTPQELIQWAHAVFGERLAAISAMQRAGNVLCHLLSTMPVNLSVLFVDTGVLFEETLATRDRIAAKYGTKVVTLTPEKTMAEQTAELGVLYLSVDGQKECCDLRKTQPLLKVADQYDAFIGSLRRSDGGARAQCPILAVDPGTNSLRINPLVKFDDDEMAAYIAENDVIVHPLHDQGYPSIGCNRCTTPVMPKEPKRAGRWRHLGPWSMYCGINPTDLSPDGSPAIDLPQDLVDRVLGRETDYMI